MSKYKAAKIAKAAGLPQFEYHVPCSKCGGTIFRTSNRGGCHNCAVIRAREYQRTEKGKAYNNRASLAWAHNNPGKHKSRLAKRRAMLLQRTPVWSNLDKIKDIYEKCPPGYEVDHIVPLQGKLVSGLHVPENLQYLPMSQNRAKGNKFLV
jgi:hypothetical protein